MTVRPVLCSWKTDGIPIRYITCVCRICVGRLVGNDDIARSPSEIRRNDSKLEISSEAPVTTNFGLIVTGKWAEESDDR